MKAICAIAIGLALIGSILPASAQPYGGPEYGYRDRDRDRDYRRDRDYGRDRGYGRDPDDDGRDRGQRRRDFGFNEREYLRCNPDVRRAVMNGGMESGAVHYQAYGRREGRRLSC